MDAIIVTSVRDVKMQEIGDSEVRLSSDHRESRKAAIGTLVWVLFTCLAHTFAVGLTILLYVTVVPRLEALWEDFGIEIPQISIWIIRIARFLGAYWYLGLILIFFDYVLLYVLSRPSHGMRGLAHLWAAGILLACLLMLALLIVAGLIPNISLIEHHIHPQVLSP